MLLPSSICSYLSAVAAHCICTPNLPFACYSMFLHCAGIFVSEFCIARMHGSPRPSPCPPLVLSRSCIAGNLGAHTRVDMVASCLIRLLFRLALTFPVRLFASHSPLGTYCGGWSACRRANLIPPFRLSFPYFPARLMETESAYTDPPGLARLSAARCAFGNPIVLE